MGGTEKTECLMHKLSSLTKCLIRKLANSADERNSKWNLSWYLKANISSGFWKIPQLFFFIWITQGSKATVCLHLVLLGKHKCYWHYDSFITQILSLHRTSLGQTFSSINKRVWQMVSKFPSKVGYDSFILCILV